MRRHQEQLLTLADRMIAGEIDRIFAHVCTGGGKSFLAYLLAWKLMVANLIDRVCWIVPRNNLQDQGEQTHANPYLLKMLGLRQPKLKILAAEGNTSPICPQGSLGYSTTYQAIAAAHGRGDTVHTDEFRMHRYLLVLDEFHRLSLDENRAEVEATRRLMELSSHQLLMTGFVERGDRKAIDHLVYDLEARPLRALVGAQDPRTRIAWIEYGIADAIAQKAIVNLQFLKSDGRIVLENENTRKRTPIESLSADLDDEMRHAGITEADIRGGALQTDFALDLLGRAVDSWRQHRASFRHAQMLLIFWQHLDADRILQAAIKRGIIRSHEFQIVDSRTPNARERLNEFRDGKAPPVLATVQMVYEGFDAPRLTHGVVLTRIRTLVWLAQAFARLNRTYDGKRGAWWYVPDDPAMNDCVQWYDAQQQYGLKQERKPKTGDGPTPSAFYGIDGEATKETPQKQGLPDPVDLVVIEKLKERGLDDRSARLILTIPGITIDIQTLMPPQEEASCAPVPKSERIRRREINREIGGRRGLVKTWCRRVRPKDDGFFKIVNRELKKEFHPHREPSHRNVPLEVLERKLVAIRDEKILDHWLAEDRFDADHS